MKFILRLLNKIAVYPFLAIYLRIKKYHEDISQKTKLSKGGYILVSNHTSWKDFLNFIVLNPFRCVHTWIGPLVYRHKFYRFMLKIYESIFVTTNPSDVSYYDKSIKYLKKNQIVAIFPEGKMIHDGSIAKFQPGFIRLALKSDAPIVLMYTNGKYNFKNRTRVNISKKIYIRDYFKSDNPSEKEIARVAALMRQKMIELKNQCLAMQKYHLENKLDFYWFFLDFLKYSSILIIPKIAIVFPVKLFYEKGASRKDKHVKGRGIVIGNHRSFIDPIMMIRFYRKRRINIVAAEELFHYSKFFTFALSSSHCIEFKRQSSRLDMEMFNTSLDILKGNGVVGIFPEGHIQFDENGKMMSFHGGAVLLALLTHSPIYPFYSYGPYKVFKKEYAIIGKPIYLDEYYDDNEIINTVLVNRLTQIVQDKMNDLRLQLESNVKVYSKKETKNG